MDSAKQAIIFDFDGTIADSLPAVIKVFEDLSKRPQRFTPTEVEELRHLNLIEIAAALNIPKWKTPFLLFRGRGMMRHHLRSITLQPGMSELLPELARTHDLYILTSNSRSNVQKYLSWHGLDGCFTGITGGASLLGKAPRLLQLLKRAGIDAEHTWYVGDEIRDIEAARAAGMPVVVASWGYNSRESLQKANPDALIDTVEELRKVLA